MHYKMTKIFIQCYILQNKRDKYHFVFNGPKGKYVFSKL